jgi:hypothetical protein
MLIEHQKGSTGQSMAMGVAPAIAYGVGLVLVSLRDWARVLRNLLFEEPVQDEGVDIRVPDGNADRLHRLADVAIRPAPAWIDGTDRARMPMWEQFK